MKPRLSKKSIYIDSNVFIYSAIYNPKTVPEAATSTAKLHEMVSGTIHAYTSALTWDEVTWVVRKLFDPQKAAAEGASFLRLPNLKLLNVDGATITMRESMTCRTAS